MISDNRLKKFLELAIKNSQSQEIRNKISNTLKQKNEIRHLKTKVSRKC